MRDEAGRVSRLTLALIVVASSAALAVAAGAWWLSELDFNLNIGGTT